LYGLIILLRKTANTVQTHLHNVIYRFGNRFRN